MRVLNPGSTCYLYALWVLFSLSVVAARAEVRLPHLLSDHAVLQRERPIHIWGWSDPGETVNIAFHGQQLRLVANDLGQFSGWLAPERPVDPTRSPSPAPSPRPP